MRGEWKGLHACGLAGSAAKGTSAHPPPRHVLLDVVLQRRIEVHLAEAQQYIDFSGVFTCDLTGVSTRVTTRVTTGVTKGVYKRSELP